MRILVVDDQRSARHILSTIAKGVDGVSVSEAETLEQARRILSSEIIDMAFVDIRLASDARNRDGLTLLEELRGTSVISIIVSASSEMTNVRAAMRAGAHDYLPKDDLCPELVVPVLEALQSQRRLQREVLALRASRANERLPAGLVGSSKAMEMLRTMIRRVAASDRPALVVGPTGSGKELVVRSIHALGPHPEEPLLDLNCGAIPEALMESQLFGHERGAFSGADRRQGGYLSAVGAGTLFLDEIAELPMTLQTKLLRVLETRQFRAVGSTTEQRFAGRIVSATHADLSSRARAGRFREDLLFRLNVLLIRVPGLAERREDIPP